MYYPSLARLIGLKESIFLCQLLYWVPKANNGHSDGWIYKSVEEMESETGLSYKEQIRLRKSLVEQGLLEEKYERDSHNLFFKINLEMLDAKGEHMTDGHMPKSDQAPDQKSDGTCPKVRSYKEAEITQEITQEPPTPFVKPNSPSAQDQKTVELDIYSAAKGLGELIGMAHNGRGLHKLVGAIQQAQRRWPEKRIEQAVDDIVSLWKEYLAQGHHAPIALHNWLETVGRFIDGDDWKKKTTEEKYQVDEHGGHYEGKVYVTKDGKRMPGYRPMPNKAVTA